MATLQIEGDPTDVGMSSERLARIDTHFRKYVDDGRLPGWLISVSRRGKLVHLSTYGQRDIEASQPVEINTLWRIFSMTKPITAVLALQLWEEGAFELNDPVHRYIPAFAQQKVWRAGSSNVPVLDPVVEEMRLWHLFAHTSGLTYGFMFAHPVDELYRKAGFEWGMPGDLDLEAVVDRWAALPLLFQPGSEWNYSVGLDVLGRVLEVITGQRLDELMRTRLLEPLGMDETTWFVDEAHAPRLGGLYSPDPRTGKAMRMDSLDRGTLREPKAHGGGGGLISTAHDYHRFTQMLLRGGELDGERILAPGTVKYMASNHLPGGVDLRAFARPLFSETTLDGVGFGLGVSVTIDPVKARVPGSAGEFAWGGAASTAFWIDPAEDLTVQFFTQLLPSRTHPIRSQLKQLVYQSILA
jgi:CubicO group peptidase (beta-lactamase class C family)